MSDDLLDYGRLVDRAMQGVMREALIIAAEHGLDNNHHFYLTLQTGYPGVEIPDSLRAQYPEEITIVLENQFWDLDVGEDYFAVSLSFSGNPARLSVPFDAVTAFVDPSVKFGLQFSQIQDALDQADDDGENEPVMIAENTDTDSPPKADDDVPSGPADVVTLDNFRKKK